MKKDDLVLRAYYARRKMRLIGMFLIWVPILYDFAMSGVLGFERVIVHPRGLFVMAVGSLVMFSADAVSKKYGSD